MTIDDTKVEELTEDPAPAPEPPPAPEPEPLWKQQGFASPDEALAAAIGGKAEAEARAQKLQEERDSTPIPLPTAPVYDPNKADDDPTYGAVFQQQMADWQSEVLKVATAPKPQTTQTDIDAATEGVLAAATVQGIDRYVLYGTMLSMSQDPQFAALANTPEGVKALGKLATERVKPVDKAPEPPKPTPKDAQYTGSDDATHTGKDVKTVDEETKRQKEVEKAALEGRGNDVVRLAMQKGLARPPK